MNSSSELMVGDLGLSRLVFDLLFELELDLELDLEADLDALDLGNFILWYNRLRRVSNSENK